MPSPSHKLIIPVLLMENPGVTREEFLDVLNSIPVTDMYRVRAFPEDPWDMGLDRRHWYLNQGLLGLAQILNLNYTEDYMEYRKPTRSKIGIEIYPPSLRFEEEGKASVIVDEEPDLHEEVEVIELEELDSVHVGDFVNYGWRSHYLYEGQVTEVMEEEFVKRDTPFRYLIRGRKDKVDFYRYKLRVRRLIVNRTKQDFSELEEVFKIYPQFHPDFMYDWSKETGTFNLLSYHVPEYIKWIQEDGRYYFDPDNFNRMPADLRSGEGEGYVDLICTSLGIENKAWKLFGGHGRTGSRFVYQQFLEDFPQVVEPLQKAISDAYLSIYAKKQQMTNTEYLRFRLLPRDAE